MAVTGIIPAAGQGTRMKGDEPKQFLVLSGRPVLIHTLTVLSRSRVDDFIVLVPGERVGFAKDLIEKEKLEKPVKVLAGGPERQDSVMEGLKALDSDCALVLIHDGVRPFIRPELVNDVIEAVKERGAATLAIRPVDTIKQQEAKAGRMRNLPRERLVQIQTPQGFEKDLIIEAHRRARAEGYVSTDDTDLVERMGREVALVEGDPLNIKITSREDLVLAEAILARGT